jgi:hypothetical protein
MNGFYLDSPLSGSLLFPTIEAGSSLRLSSHPILLKQMGVAETVGTALPWTTALCWASTDSDVSVVMLPAQTAEPQATVPRGARGPQQGSRTEAEGSQQQLLGVQSGADQEGPPGAHRQ